MNHHNDNPGIRKGRFLWMDPESRSKYLADLNRKIRDGFYTSDEIIEQVVGELAPAFSDSVNGEKAVYG